MIKTFLAAPLAGLLAIATPAPAQQACGPTVSTGGFRVDIVKVERSGGVLTIGYVITSDFNLPMRIRPSHWGNDKHIVRDSDGNDWAFQHNYGLAQQNWTLENGQRKKSELVFTLQQGDPTAAAFDISLNFMTIPGGGGMKLGQSRMAQAKWRNVKVGCGVAAAS